MLEPEVETLPWAEQRALDDARYRAQLGYLFDRSAFYRAKLAAAGVESAAAPAGSTRSRSLPLTEKERAPRRPCTRGAARSARTLRDAARDRPDLLDERHHRDAELHAAHRRGPRQLGDRVGAELRRLRASSAASASSRPTMPGPFVAGAALACLRAHRPVPHPGRHGQHRAAAAGDRAAGPEAAVLHAILRGLPRRVGARARRRSAGIERRARPRRRRAGRRRAGVPREARGRHGARRSPRRWASATSASRSGASAKSRTGMHLGARGFVHVELIDPETGARCRWTTAPTGELVLTHLRHRGRAAAALPHARPRASSGPGPAAVAAPSPRVRCIGRTDDMLIVRGVNVFPVGDPRGGERVRAARSAAHILVRPKAEGVKQEPPLPVSVELAREARDDADLARAIRERLREVLVVQTRRRARPVGNPAAQRVQVDARRAKGG